MAAQRAWPLLGIEFRFVDYPARSLVIMLIELFPQVFGLVTNNSVFECVCGDEFWRDVELRSCTHITHASGTDLPVTIRPSSGHRAFPHVWFIAWFTTQCCSMPHLSDTFGNVIITDCHPVLMVGDFNPYAAGGILQCH